MVFVPGLRRSPVQLNSGAEIPTKNFLIPSTTEIRRKDFQLI